ncbi:hypothetical protein B4U80_14804, partial [Leptotrombidium deliense]
MQEVVSFANKAGKSRIGKHTFLKRKQQLTDWKRYDENGGTYTQKVIAINSFVYEQYCDAKSRLCAVHDINFRAWAIRKARELNLNKFKASKKWLWNFKVSHRIASRKITKVVSRKYKGNCTNIMNRASRFVEETNSIICGYDRDNVFNTDQSGFNYEYVSK